MVFDRKKLLNSIFLQYAFLAFSYDILSDLSEKKLKIFRKLG